MAHKGQILLDTRIEEPEEGYVNLRFDPVSLSLIVKFSTGHEKVISQAFNEPFNFEEIDGGSIFGNNLGLHTKQNPRW